jgi:transposase InsO family protein
MTAEKAMETIVQEEKRLEMEGKGKDDKNEAYLAKQHRKDKNKTREKSHLVCKHCKKHGHLQDQCYRLHPELMPPSWKERSSSHEKGSGMHSQTENLAFTFSTQNPQQDRRHASWFVDSGASNHLTFDKSQLIDYVEYPAPKQCGGISSQFFIYGYGKIRLQCVRDISRTITLSNVNYSPQATANLLSTEQVKGIIWTIANGIMQGRLGSKLVFHAVHLGGQYRLRIEQGNGNAVFMARQESQDSRVLWHSRLAHVNHGTLSKLHLAADGIPKFQSLEPTPFCEPCTVAKLTRTVSRKPLPLTTRKLELVHSDVGTMPLHSIGGYKHYTTFTDDKTRYRWTELMEHKSDLEKVFHAWRQRVEMESQARIQRLRTDNGGEYISHSFTNSLYQAGIKHEKTPAYTPEMNGVSERLNRTLVEAAKAILSEAELDDEWWGEAIMTATYLRNLIPTTKNPTTTPFEAWKGEKPDLRHLRIFGSEC